MSEALRPHHGVRRSRHSRHAQTRLQAPSPRGRHGGGDSRGRRDTCGCPGSATYCCVFVARSLNLSLSFHTRRGLANQLRMCSHRPPSRNLQKAFQNRKTRKAAISRNSRASRMRLSGVKGAVLHTQGRGQGCQVLFIWEHQAACLHLVWAPEGRAAPA